ncbi:septum formation inhibitor Maf [Helicobacter valdiviensis]|uniref:Septum formation inhibitor Maf n=1 Tax=Helicobacter valdiviensis TaxID=1458358 RepID=A0A2W6MWB1_9HELI|nr:septum formation inhibitor Maf [Helicobacter valdiviensis]PZT48697.1 septum formation inhibitor Maf [Helicobacter valdiviensis]
MLRLCSTSKIRSHLLKMNNIPFIQSDNFFDEESLQIDNPKDFVYHATLGKHKSAIDTYGLSLPLLIADSVVMVENKLQRKAKNLSQAREFLQTQSGNCLSILTCMIYHSQSKFFIDISATYYEFEKFQDNDLEDYLSSNLWKNKAGCIMCEGFHSRYIKRQIGSSTNALGLNIEVLKTFL